MITVLYPLDESCADERSFSVQIAHRRELILQVLDEELKKAGCEVTYVSKAVDLRPLRGHTVISVIWLDGSGINLEWSRMIRKIRSDDSFMAESIGSVIVDAPSEVYTKAVGREAVLSMNRSGCRFPGRPLVEGTESLYNYHVISQLQSTDLTGAYVYSVRDLIRRIMSEPAHEVTRRPRLLVLHASIRKTSNTMRLWEMVRNGLGDAVEIQEMSLRNGEMQDCGGCPFTMCMHFSEKGQCYYGGVMVEQVYPAVEECDGILLLCPNYNDAISANLSAFINRLTALYRRKPFYDKKVFGIIVSGYSGGDIVARQLISALNMNKAFCLPAHFCMIETANDPGTIEYVEGIRERAASFAQVIRSSLP